MKSTRGISYAGAGKRLLSLLLVLTMILSMLPSAMAETEDQEPGEEQLLETALLTEEPETAEEQETADEPETAEEPETEAEGDPTADVETETEWTAAFADVTRTGHYGADLLAIARTQLGYTESAANYVTVEGERCGYTRYGAWYGNAYGDWCAMFVSFCLNYAGVPAEKLAREGSVERWIGVLEEQGLYEDACRYRALSAGETVEENERYAFVYIYLSLIHI